MTHEGPFKVNCPSQPVCEVCVYSQHVCVHNLCLKLAHQNVLILCHH